MRRPWPGSRVPVVLIAAAGLASCVPIGIPEGPGPVLVASEPAARAEVLRAPTVRTGGAVSLSPRTATGRPLDPILDSPAAMDSVFQRQVAFWIEFWTTEQKDWFGLYLERMGQYGPFVAGEVAERGLPGSLWFLPIVESGYSPRAVSRVGATGLWQLMAPTAGDFDLHVSSIVDDRRDPVASTDAALEYLGRLNEQFESWFLALAAYNVGQGRVRQLLNQVRRDGGDDGYMAIRSLLPAETREFVPRLFAAAAIASDPTAYGFDAIVWNPIVFDEVTVPDATSLDVVAEAAGVAQAEVAELNLHFLRGFTPPGSARVVRVPAGSGGAFREAFALIPPDERLSFLEHVVTNGETFSHIAIRYGVRLDELMATNGTIDPKRLRIGMRVVVPVGGRPTTSAGGTVTQVATRDANADPVLHTVAPGESLWTIARRYGVSTEALAEENERIASSVIRPGERLRIP